MLAAIIMLCMRHRAKDIISLLVSSTDALLSGAVRLLGFKDAARHYASHRDRAGIMAAAGRPYSEGIILKCAIVFHCSFDWQL